MEAETKCVMDLTKKERVSTRVVSVWTWSWMGVSLGHWDPISTRVQPAQMCSLQPLTAMHPSDPYTSAMHHPTTSAQEDAGLHPIPTRGLSVSYLPSACYPAVTKTMTILSTPITDTQPHVERDKERPVQKSPLHLQPLSQLNFDTPDEQVHYFFSSSTTRGIFLKAFSITTYCS
ncbi:unnamed protein product [Coregonus sp. 'balchen']|nr:unnamed protein product [Coregonus sp. 'balchen']